MCNSHSCNVRASEVQLAWYTAPCRQMSLKAKIEAVIYAAEEPVTLQQLVGLLGQEAQAELDAAASRQGQLALLDTETLIVVQEIESGDQDALNAETLGTEVFAAIVPEGAEGDQGLGGSDGADAGSETGSPDHRGTEDASETAAGDARPEVASRPTEGRE